MIAITAQTWLALAMIALAAIYLARCAWRTLKGQSSGPGCCSTGCCSTDCSASSSPLTKGGPRGGERPSVAPNSPPDLRDASANSPPRTKGGPRGGESLSTPQESSVPQPKPATTFIPLENLADLARRHKQERGH
jgi:hypothetical protein